MSARKSSPLKMTARLSMAARNLTGLRHEKIRLLLDGARASVGYAQDGAERAAIVEVVEAALAAACVRRSSSCQKIERRGGK